MTHLTLKYCWQACLSLTVLLSCCVTAAETEQLDVRILVDMSGSMKKNDPDNLRVPAVRLITNLLPKDSKAGVWAFGQYVNMLVPLKPVDENWKALALAEAGKINSKGLYTNIGEALSRASYGWSYPNEKEKRHIILLTDGMVDISKDAEKNKLAREKVIHEVLPKLKSAGVHIHTLALSQEADIELLAKLALETDGWHEAIAHSSQLERVFLKLFEQTAEPDAVPLVDNKFQIDSSVEEFTLLVFRQASSDPSVLVTPAGDKIAQDSDVQGIKWHQENSYDMITVKSPQAGGWQVIADIDPDNRVMVVSNLSIALPEVAKNFLANEKVDYQVTILEDNKPITEKKFLSVVSMKLSVKQANNVFNDFTLYDDGDNADENEEDGTFSGEFNVGDAPGPVTLKLTVKSPTFQRTKQTNLNVAGSPIDVDVQLTDEPETAMHKVIVSPKVDLVARDNLVIQAEVVEPDSSKRLIGLPDEGKLHRVLELQPVAQGGVFEVKFLVEGESVSGRKFNIVLDPIKVTTSAMESYTEEEVIDEPVEEEVVEQKPEQEEKVVEEKPKEVSETNQQDEKEKQEKPTEDEVMNLEDVDWVFWISIGLGGNVILFGSAFFAIRWYKNKHQTSVDELAEELDEDE